MKRIKVGLCKGRHDITGIDEYIYPFEVNPLEVVQLEDIAYNKLIQLFLESKELPDQVYIRRYLDLYVTGLTVALVAVLNACRRLGIVVTLYHYNKDNGEYYPQKVL